MASLTEEQQAYSSQWTTILKTGQIRDQLLELTNFLRDNAFIAGTSKPLKIDEEYFQAVSPVLKELIASSKDVTETYSKYRHVIRWALYMQACLGTLEAHDKLIVPEGLELPREVIEKKKKAEGAKDGDAKGKKEEGKGKKGEAAPAPAKAQEGDGKGPRGKPDEATLAKLREEAKAKKAAKKAAAAATGGAAAGGDSAAAKVSPSVVDLRVGFIQKAVKHPDADALYVSTIDVGNPDGPLTVCSGLVKHYSLEEMQERYVVLVCNLKPVTMRGIKSTAMVLCGSLDGKVEFVVPPEGSKPGDKVFVEGYGHEEPLSQLNPKKKIWEKIQPKYTTNASLDVVYRDEDDKEHPVRKLTNARGESFKVASLVNANIQ